ncbi:MAG: hypothetical protein QOG62_298 [Thermoleophilaceae bacterium]|jgi:amino acid transporter|nr:hypothetical protein [Thermoleophilaceae bacterium]
MESASIAPQAAPVTETGDKGLKKNAISYLSSIVIGVASTAPGYSLAATLGFVIAGVGLQSPAVLWVAFIPMLFIATSYFYMNKADPDCGTTFSWVTRAMGPSLGWLGGWAIIVADIIVMANLAQIAGLYSILLFSPSTDPDSVILLTTAIGVVWIVIMTAICTIGIELSARVQQFLLGAEVLTLTAFAVVALIRVYSGNALDTAVTPDISWFSPFAIDSTSALIGGVLLSVFIYWGWDSAVTVNEETEDSSSSPGKSAIVSTILLVLIYVIVSTAAIAFGGPDQLSDSDDVLSILGTQVFGSPLDKIIIIAVLTSAAASTQTTILPTARTSLSMARAKAMPAYFGKIHPRYLTPHVSTLWMGGLSILWYVGLTLVSTNILYDSLAALGLMIAFYYGITGFACVIFYRKDLFKSIKNFFFIGVAPTIGAVMLTAILIKSGVDLSDPANSESGTAWLGVGPPLIIAVGFMVMGLVLMIFWRAREPEFWRRRLETYDESIHGGAGAEEVVDNG